MEMAQPIDNGRGMGSEYVDDAADVTTEHDFWAENCDML